MHWLNEPTSWSADDDVITIISEAQTDFWRKTHYGFIRDNGHFYYQFAPGDFAVEVKVSGQYRALYDQAGLMVRLDSANWLKCGVEYVGDVQQASAVVTRDYSDWSMSPLLDNPESIWLRISRTGPALEVQFSLDGENYFLLRMAYLTSATVQVGIMCASPDGDGFTAVFENFRLERFHESQ